MLNYTLQDILSSSLGVILFSLVLLTPGYVTGWLADLFDFRRRTALTRFVIAIPLSFAISPILFFLVNFISGPLALIVAGLLCAAFVYIAAKNGGLALRPVGYQRTALAVAIGWIIFAILMQVDLQWGNRLYFPVTSFDLTTRTAVTAAITRTGVPPINPSYYPGEPVRLTQLYYFWYILASLVDRLGLTLVDARTAMIASAAWCGLGLMALIALYLRERYQRAGNPAWKNALTGSALLLITGLDAVPALAMMYLSRLTIGYSVLDGDIEHWNEVIIAWLGYPFWVPHHTAALIACLTGFLVFQALRKDPTQNRAVKIFVIGLAFASGFGLSVWVTLVFALFWGIWMITLCMDAKERRVVWAMLMAGIVAIIVISPYLMGLLIAGSGTGLSSNGLPFALHIRPFRLGYAFEGLLSPLAYNLIQFVLLPINYIFELGFFFFAGILWLENIHAHRTKLNLFVTPEIIMLSVSVLVGSFIKSTVIANNDLGWRSWLFGQFILLIWGLDVIMPLLEATPLPAALQRQKRILLIFAALGLFTTFVDAASLRFWVPLVDLNIPGYKNGLSPDTHLGERTYDGRHAYEYIRDHLPENIINQHNPHIFHDRPSGLYGTRQFIIADHAAYGLSQRDYEELVQNIGAIFEPTQTPTWASTDALCLQYKINILVLNDTDPLWNYLPTMKPPRTPLFSAPRFKVYACAAVNP